VQTDGVVVCRTPPRDSRSSDCVRLRGDLAELGSGDGGGSWIDRAYPSLGPVDHLFGDRRFGGVRLSYRMPLRVPARAPRREIVTLVNYYSELYWQIDYATGADALPARSVRVGGETQTDGEIVFSVTFPDGSNFPTWLPSFVELPEGEGAEIFKQSIGTRLD